MITFNRSQLKPRTELRDFLGKQCVLLEWEGVATGGGSFTPKKSIWDENDQLLISSNSKHSGHTIYRSLCLKDIRSCREEDCRVIENRLNRNQQKHPLQLWGWLENREEHHQLHLLLNVLTEWSHSHIKVNTKFRSNKVGMLLREGWRVNRKPKKDCYLYLYETSPEGKPVPLSSKPLSCQWNPW